MFQRIRTVGYTVHNYNKLIILWVVGSESLRKIVVIYLLTLTNFYLHSLHTIKSNYLCVYNSYSKSL